jgi:hypothetical protein
MSEERLKDLWDIIKRTNFSVLGEGGEMRLKGKTRELI